MTHKAKALTCHRLDPKAALTAASGTWEMHFNEKVACSLFKVVVSQPCTLFAYKGVRLWPSGTAAKHANLSPPPFPLSIGQFGLWAYHTRIFALAVQIVRIDTCSLALGLKLDSDNDNITDKWRWMETSQNKTNEEIFL